MTTYLAAFIIANVPFLNAEAQPVVPQIRAVYDDCTASGGTNWAGGTTAFVKAQCSPGPAGSGTGNDESGDYSGPLVPNGVTCVWRDVDEPVESTRWGSRTPADGHFEAFYCGAAEGDGSGTGGPVAIEFVSNKAAVPPPPDPATLAEQAIEEITIPIPWISVGPDREKLAVNLWTWLWTDDPGPLTATAAAGGVSVTATATLDSITWSLGEPAPTGGAYASGPSVTLTCQGTGSAPPPDYDWKAQPPCGHKYTWMSTKERTGGTGTWPITATSNWTVTWQSNTGVTGTATLNSTGNDALEIGEYRTVLVQGPGG